MQDTDGSNKRLMYEDTVERPSASPSSRHNSESASKKVSGWRKGIQRAIYAVGIVLLINIMFTIVAIAKDGTKDGTGTLYTGKCKAVSTEKVRWSSTSTNGSWLRLFTFYSFTLIITTLLLTLGIRNISSNGKNISFTSLSFGAVSPYALITLLGEGALNVQLDTAKVLVPIILLANAPQLIFSCLYLMYNRIYTRALASEEWTKYAYKRQALRVSYPTGIQRSTYWLHLPYKYSVPLLVSSGLMHWLVSQAIFLARVKIYSIDGTYNETQSDPPYGYGGGATPAANDGFTINGSLTLPGYSPKAIIAVMVVGTIMLIALIAQSFKTYPTGLPLAGNNSLAISAACHVAAQDREDAAEQPLMCGAIKAESTDGPTPAVGHCCFSSLEVEAPVPGRLYA